MEKISISHFDDVYHLFQRSFVLEELRPYEQMKKLFQQNLFSIYAKYDHNELQGAMIVWELENCIYFSI